MVCIVTGMAGACSRVAMTRPHDTARKGHNMVSRARGAWLARESRYKKLYRGWGRLFYHNMAAIRCSVPYDTAQERCDTHDRRMAGACVAIQSLYRDRGR